MQESLNILAERTSETQESLNILAERTSETQERTIGNIIFRHIPKGTFTMGSPVSEGHRDDDEAQRKVTLVEDFWMGRYEVTQSQWQSIMGSNPSKFNGANKPVEQVSWNDCQEFINKLNIKYKAGLPEGYIFDFPTDVQWEYACRAGKTTVFHYGNRLSSKQANFNGKYPYGTEVKGPDLDETIPVGSYLPNAFGLFDMHGNVLEWCRDWYVSGAKRLRGGSWEDAAWDCRSANRFWRKVDKRDDEIGLRLVLRKK